MTVIVLPAASEEFEAAEEGYNLQRTGLGKRYKELVTPTAPHVSLHYAFGFVLGVGR